MIHTAEEQKHYRKMTETKIPKLVLSLAWPSVIAMLSTAIYNMADTFFVSRISTSATAAVGIVMPLMMLFQAVGFTFATGAGSLISLYLGKREQENANRFASSALFASIFFTSIITLLTLLNLSSILEFFGASRTSLPPALEYASVITIASPVFASSFVLNFILRAEGKNMFAMIGTLSGGFLNVILDPIIMFGLNFGIKGAAIATAISQIVSWVILYIMIQHKSIVRLNISYFSKKIETYISIMKLGIPSFFRSGLGSFAGILLNNRAALFGDAAVAAISIVGRIGMFLLSAVLGFGQGFQPISGYNYGAEKYGRVREAYFFTLKIMLSVLTCIAFIMFVFAKNVIGIFSSDPKMLSIAVFYLRLTCLALCTQPFLISTNMLMQSTGQAKAATFLALTRQGIFFIPLILVLPKLYGLFGVQISQPISDLLSALTGLYFAINFSRELKEKETALE